MSGPVVDIGVPELACGYALLLVPLSILFWLRVPLIRDSLVGVMRMTLQLLFVGFYLQVVFELNNSWLNAAWLMVMIGVADVSILRRCRLRIGRLAAPLALALLVGTLAPLFVFLFPILHRPRLLDAQYAIPLGGMILGNCLRADIIGIQAFFTNVRKAQKPFQLALAQGASLREAVRPFVSEACQAALAPTVATLTTIGLVALPGMMTGVILGGTNPMVAIKYQILIMIAIFSGATITVAAAIHLALRSSFTPYGMLDPAVFAD